MRIAALGVLLVACNADRLVAPAPQATPAISGPERALVGGSAVVISQVYGAGGNTGAALTNDYIELFNRGDADQDISNWKLYYGSAAGTSWSNQYTIPSGKVIRAGKYFLIQLSGGATGLPLPSPDASGTINMSGTAGKIMLAKAGMTTPTVGCPSDLLIVDRVAFGSSSGTNSCDVEWGRTAAPSTSNATHRKFEGCMATGVISSNLSVDFEALAAKPRNSGSNAPTSGCVLTPSVTVTPSTVAVSLGSTTKLNVWGMDANGSAMSGSPVWASSDEAIATVDATGNVLGKATGTAIVSATLGGQVGSATVNVSQTVATVSISPATVSLLAGGPTQQLTATGLDAGGNVVSSASFTWTSSATGVATVNSSGVVTGVAAGTATITAKAGNGVTGTASVTVTAVSKPPIVISQVYGGGGNSGASLKNDFIELLNPGTTPVTVDGWSVQVWSGSTSAWQATPISGTIQPGQYYLVQESQGAAGTTNLPTPDAVGTILMSSTASRVILVQQATAATDPCPSTYVDRMGYGASGCATAWGVADVPQLSNTTAALRKTGGCTFTDLPANDYSVVAPNPRNSVSPTNLCVPAGPLDHVLITGTATSVQVGATVQFIAFGQDVNNLPVSSPTTTWSSSSAAVTVDNTGKVTGVTESATPVVLTATVTAGGITKTSTVSLTVRPAAVIVSVTVAPATSSLEVSQTRSFTVSAIDNEGTTLTPVVTWSTENPAVATVTSSGVLTGVTVGTTTLTATAANGVVGTAAITVTPKSGNLSLQAHTETVPVGFQTGMFIGAGVDGSGAPISSSTVTWSTSNAAIATINPTTGILTGVGAGTVTVTATANTDGVTKGSTPVVVAVLAEAPAARPGANTDLGVPSDDDPSDDLLIARNQYTLSYNHNRGVANWVSWNLDASHSPATGGVARCNCFSRDPDVAAAGFPAWETNDFNNTGSNGNYSRGHLSPSADWNISAGDNARTFFLSNMLPQNQPMNAGPWGSFEDYLRQRITNGSEIYIVAGGIFTKNRTYLQTVNGNPVLRTYTEGFGTVSDRGQIAIPDSIWKIAVIVPDTRSVTQIGTPSEVEVIAINTPNEAPVSGATWQTYQTTIAKIEQSTGYNFLSAMPEAIQCRLESRNCAPVAKVTGSSATDEGQSLTFSGATSSDADGDAISYAWTVDGAAAGTGSTLTHAFPNSGASVVELTVTDGKGGSSTASFPVSVANVAPTSGIVGPDHAVEGAAFTVSAANVADPSPADVAAGFSYAFDCGKGFGAFGSATSTSCVADDNGSLTVRVKVRDQDGGESPVYEQAVTVTNANPTATFSNDASVAEGSSFALSLAGFADASPTDVAAGFTFEFDCGAGLGYQASTAATVSCATSDNGTRAVKARITDKDGGSTEYTGTTTITNVAPSAVTLSTSSLTLTSGQSLTATGSFTDAGANDNPWNWTVDFGNASTKSGSLATIAGISTSATYLKAGSYTVTLAVTDKDGATGQATPVTIVVDRVALAGQVNPATINVSDRAQGVIGFAVLGSAGFDATLVDAATARIGGVPVQRKPNGDLFTVREDVNNDGILDYVLRFDRNALVSAGAITSASTSLSLQADLRDGRQVTVAAPVTTKP